MARGLTVKQQKFAIFLVGAANGNQTLAARMAGYKGDDRQLAVQGSVNVRHPQIEQMIHDRLGDMVEPSLGVFAEGLTATKRRAFVTKAGEICYTDPEPDHRVRTATADRILDRYLRTCGGYVGGFDADVVPAHENGAEQLKKEADSAKTEGCEDSVELDAADRALFEQVAGIDAELAEIDRDLADHDDHGSHHDVGQRSSTTPLSIEAEPANSELADHDGDHGTDHEVEQRSSAIPLGGEAELAEIDSQLVDPGGDHGSNE